MRCIRCGHDEPHDSQRGQCRDPNCDCDAPSYPDTRVTDAEVEAACETMHDAYEAAAVEAGWETQAASRKPWSEVPEANKATMRAAVRALLESLASGPRARQTGIDLTSSPASAGAEAPLPVRGDGDAGEERAREALADWLGNMPEAHNVRDYTDEETTVITIEVEALVEMLHAAGCRIPIHLHMFATRDNTWCGVRDLTFTTETGMVTQQGYPSTHDPEEMTCEDCKARYAEVEETPRRDAKRVPGAD